MKYEFKLPKMGESISEATIISWFKSVGDSVLMEETLVEVATDKVDSEVQSPVSGIVQEIKFNKGDVVVVGQVMAIIEASDDAPTKLSMSMQQQGDQRAVATEDFKVSTSAPVSREPKAVSLKNVTADDSFLSPLIISIAKKENLTIEELQRIPGTGAGGRLRKSDLFTYLENRRYTLRSEPVKQAPPGFDYGFVKPRVAAGANDRVVEMDRMRQMIAGHMVYSKTTSPHVTSYLEVDVTNLVQWRTRSKDAFLDKHQQKLTFTPIFVDAVAKALDEFPMMNVATIDEKIIVRGEVNVGMATALPSGNLIVPVVRNANRKSMPELAAEVNRLAESARTNKLKPDDIQGSTFTISNVGTFGSLMGTPIINQPEAGILAFGIIKKRAEVIETAKGDEIAIRSMMFLSLSFDHRIVDGFLGGSFLRRVGDILENFDIQTAV
jgi:2-oxoglutarate dehydrogenase E2 component (dihydrolipoamide succinyltransferase)